MNPNLLNNSKSTILIETKIGRMSVNVEVEADLSQEERLEVIRTVLDKSPEKSIDHE